MKRNLLYILIAVLALSACKKGGLEKFEIEKSFPDTTLAFNDFKKLMAAGTDGFKIQLQSTAGNFYGGFIKLDATNAKFVLDNSLTQATIPQVTEYSIKSSQTNAVFSLGSASTFANFAKSVVGIDTSYSFKAVSGDTIKMVGNAKGTKLSLIKTNKASADAYLGGKMGETITTINALNSFKLYFKRLTVGGKSYDLILNTKLKHVTFNYLNGAAFASFSTGFVYTSNGLQFTKTFTDGTVKISNLSGIITDVTAGTGLGKIGESNFTISNEASPLTYDLTAVNTFYAGGSSVIPNSGVGLSWLSYTGFTVNGVKDYYGVTTIVGLNYLSITPRYNVSYDRLGFVVNGIFGAYGPAIAPVFKANGTLVYTYLGGFGNPAPAYTAIVNNTRLLMCESLGYYVIKSGPNNYDFVSVKDGAAWMSFE